MKGSDAFNCSSISLARIKKELKWKYKGNGKNVIDNHYYYNSLQNYYKKDKEDLVNKRKNNEFYLQ